MALCCFQNFWVALVRLLDVKEELCHHICFYLFYYYHYFSWSVFTVFCNFFYLYYIIYSISSDAYLILRSVVKLLGGTLARPTLLCFPFACNIWNDENVSTLKAINLVISVMSVSFDPSESKIRCARICLSKKSDNGDIIYFCS